MSFFVNFVILSFFSVFNQIFSMILVPFLFTTCPLFQWMDIFCVVDTVISGCFLLILWALSDFLWSAFFYFIVFLFFGTCVFQVIFCFPSTFIVEENHDLCCVFFQLLSNLHYLHPLHLVDHFSYSTTLVTLLF